MGSVKDMAFDLEELLHEREVISKKIIALQFELSKCNPNTIAVGAHYALLIKPLGTTVSIERCPLATSDSPKA